MPGALSGVRQFRPTSAPGDGYVQFVGKVQAGGMIGDIAWEGFTATAPFQGMLVGPLGRQIIGVLDNTGGKMIIYDGKATLGPPRTLGEFLCDWQ